MDGIVTVDGGGRFALGSVATRVDGGRSEAAAEERLNELQIELRELQELMFASEATGVLVVLQGMDAAGKDVTIQQVFATATAEAIRVKHFTAPTDEEAAHDFLWRAHSAAPGRGELVIFDRSYYEEILLPIIEGGAGADETRRRCDDALAFEGILQHGGTIVLKFFLHVGADEQERRLREREADEATAWKISARDWLSREQWDDYMRAYEQVIQATGTPDAPWHVVPADDQRFHNLAVAETLVGCLRPYRERWLAERKRIGEEKRHEAQEARAGGAEGSGDHGAG